MSHVDRRCRKVFLVGTHHTYQYGVGSTYGAGCSIDSELAFRNLVRTISHGFGVRALAEELNEDALAEHQVQKSVLQQEAARLTLPHCFCEPSWAERRTLGVQQEGDIRVTAWRNGWSEERIQQELLGEFRKREAVWCDRLLELNTWPVLFVCGANHVHSFSLLLVERGLVVEVLETCWEQP